LSGGRGAGEEKPHVKKERRDRRGRERDEKGEGDQQKRREIKTKSRIRKRGLELAVSWGGDNEYAIQLGKRGGELGSWSKNKEAQKERRMMEGGWGKNKPHKRGESVS